MDERQVVPDTVTQAQRPIELTTGKPPGWTPEMVEALGKNILPYVDRFLSLRESELKHDARVVRDESAHQRKTTLALLAFAGVVIIAMSVLTAVGHVSGDALLFLVGTVVGAAFSLLQRQLFEQRVGASSENGEG